MPGMRVHELAKEFDMTSKELLDRLAEMKIPAKSHASILQDAYVQKVRKNLEPEIKQRAGELEDEEAKQLAEKKAEEAQRKADEEAERRAAVEAEREAREAERARREAKQAAKQEKAQNNDATPKKKISNSPFESLASQIERERERVEREAAEERERNAQQLVLLRLQKNKQLKKHFIIVDAKTQSIQPRHKSNLPKLLQSLQSRTFLPCWIKSTMKRNVLSIRSKRKLRLKRISVTMILVVNRKTINAEIIRRIKSSVRASSLPFLNWNYKMILLRGKIVMLRWPFRLRSCNVIKF